MPQRRSPWPGEGLSPASRFSHWVTESLIGMDSFENLVKAVDHFLTEVQ